MPVIDIDAHWTEPPDLWRSRAPAKLKDRVPRIELDEEGGQRWVVDTDTVLGPPGLSVIRPDGSKVTGLLSLGAAALGCDQVLACDFNRLAVQTTAKNICLNQFEDQVLAFQAKGEEVISIPCDLLVANIHYDVMQHLIAHPAFLEKPWFILSGLLNSETRTVLAVLKELPVHIIERRCPDGIWNTILGRRVE